MCTHSKLDGVGRLGGDQVQASSAAILLHPRVFCPRELSSHSLRTEEG